MTSTIGEMIVTLFLLLNIVFAVLIAVMDTHNLEGEDTGFDIYILSVDRGDAYTGDLSHHNGRAAIIFTFVGAGIYMMQLIRQVKRLLNKEERQYDGRWTIVVESALAFIFAMTAWILVIVEGGAATDELKKDHTAMGTTAPEVSIGAGWIFLMLIAFMNLFIFVRTGMLAYMADSWPKAIGGSFGSGTARVAEKFPVMGIDA